MANHGKSVMADAMRRRAGIAQDPSPVPLWQRVVDHFRAAPGDETAEAAKEVDQAVHDQVLPESLQIKEALEAQRRKKAMIDAMLRGAE
jgi:hypothetical protein